MTGNGSTYFSSLPPYPMQGKNHCFLYWEQSVTWLNKDALKLTWDSSETHQIYWVISFEYIFINSELLCSTYELVNEPQRRVVLSGKAHRLVHCDQHWLLFQHNFCRPGCKLQKIWHNCLFTDTELPQSMLQILAPSVTLRNSDTTFSNLEEKFILLIRKYEKWTI